MAMLSNDVGRKLAERNKTLQTVRFAGVIEGCYGCMN